jgi:hypothetical protein
MAHERIRRERIVLTNVWSSAEIVDTLLSSERR